MNKLIEVNDLVKSYHDGVSVQALRGVSLALATGEFVALIGPSGSGKSTLLHLLGGLDRPNSGSIRFRERELTALDDRAIDRYRNQEVGFVFQFHHLIPELTALENVVVPGLIAGHAHGTVERWAKKLLERMGLGDRLFHYPTQLSGGERQRVAVVRALVNDPALLLADEPTGDLDQKRSNELLGLLNELHRGRGTTLLVASHDRDLIAQADRALFLQDGRIVPELVSG